jgi:hypothetical protein
MKISRIVQFAVAALLVSSGCGLLLADVGTSFATICFGSASFVLYRRSELSRSVPVRELRIIVGVLAALAAFILIANHFFQRSSGEHFFHQPLVVGLIWVVSMVALSWRWSGERRQADVS